MGSKSTITIVGQLAFDPEMQYHERGGESVAVTNLRIATNRKYRGEDEVTWYRVAIWGSDAENTARFCKKGTSVVIEGRLIPNEAGSPRVFEHNGEFKASYEVYAYNVTFVANLREQGDSVAEQFGAEVGAVVRDYLDDVPRF